MSDLSKVSKLMRIGSVITATLATFIFAFPVIKTNENDGVSWPNIFAFVAGVLTVLLYDKVINRKIKKSNVFVPLGLLIIVFCCYEVLLFKSSVSCFDELRCVIGSEEDIKSSVKIDYKAWLAYDNPRMEIVQANQCEPLKVWDFNDLSLPYYSFIALYFLIIILFVLVIVSIYDKLLLKDEK